MPTESLRIRLGMEPYSDDSAVKYNGLNSNDNWLRKRQGLALPALPPTTIEARKYFFSKIRHFAALASENGRGKIDYEAFAQEWNQSADGLVRFYVTADVLSAYAKGWEKMSNIRASQELIKGKMDHIQKSGNVFAAALQPFPAFLTSAPISVHPRQGVADLMDIPGPSKNIPPSISTALAISHPHTPGLRIAVQTQDLAHVAIDQVPCTRPAIHDHIVNFNDQLNYSEPYEDLATPTMGLAVVDHNDDTISNSLRMPESHSRLVDPLALSVSTLKDRPNLIQKLFQRYPF